MRDKGYIMYKGIKVESVYYFSEINKFFSGCDCRIKSYQWNNSGERESDSDKGKINFKEFFFYGY